MRISNYAEAGIEIMSVLVLASTHSCSSYRQGRCSALTRRSSDPDSTVTAGPYCRSARFTATGIGIGHFRYSPSLFDSDSTSEITRSPGCPAFSWIDQPTMPELSATLEDLARILAEVPGAKS